MEALLSLINSIPDWLAAITALVTAANGITMLTPSKADNTVIDGILRVLNALSLNIGKNKNADA